MAYVSPPRTTTVAIVEAFSATTLAILPKMSWIALSMFVRMSLRVYVGVDIATTQA